MVNRDTIGSDEKLTACPQCRGFDILLQSYKQSVREGPIH